VSKPKGNLSLIHGKENNNTNNNNNNNNINIILFVLKVQPNTTYKLFTRNKNKQRCIEKSAIVNRYKES